MESIYRNVPLDATDVLGRTPLHAAVISGSVECIQIFTNGCSSAMVSAPLIQDKWQRCPLHWACTHSYDNTGSFPANSSLTMLACFRKGAADMLNAVRVLIDAYPEATLIRDCDGKTPLDLALENNADPSVVAMVDKAERAIRKERRQKGDFWDASYNMEATSASLTEFESFRNGFPGEISVHTRTSAISKSSRFDYICFEC
jgi:ankyrin repeat protein